MGNFEYLSLKKWQGMDFLQKEEIVRRQGKRISVDEPDNERKTIVVNFEYETKEGDKAYYLREFRYLQEEDIEKKLSEDTWDFQDCYVDSFNSKSYINSITERYEIEGINAENAFFANGFILKLVRISDSVGLNFRGAYFDSGDVEFGGLVVANGITNFAYAQIYNVIKFEVVNSIFEAGDVSFNKVLFNAEKIEFISTQFKKGKVGFHNTKFMGEAVFTFSTFLGKNVVFSKSIFEKEAYFYGVKFLNPGELLFDEVLFKFAASFQRIEIEKEISFSEACFSNGANFEKAKFKVGTANFSEVNLDGTICFVGTKFENNQLDFSSIDGSKTNSVVWFKDVNLEKVKMDFYSADLYGIEFQNVVFSENDFGDSEINQLRFENCRFKGSCNLKPKKAEEIVLYKCMVEFTMDIDGFDKITLAESKNIGSIFLNWDKCNIERDFYLPRKNQVDDPAKIKERQLVLLKENYHNLGEYDWEDETFVESMRCKRQRKNIRPLEKALNYSVDAIGRYGTSPGKVALTMGVIWLLFGFIFGGIMQCAPESFCISADVKLNFINGFYYSAITFLTMSYNYIPCNGIIKCLAIFEGFIGLFMMSFFTVAVVRKILR